MRDVTHIVFHCTGASQAQTPESVLRYWRDRLRWKTVGYHRLVSADGTIHTLADDEQITNGVAGHNKHSIHLCYIGGVDAQGKPLDNRTDAQKRSLFSLLKHYTAKYPKARVLGHRDFPGVRKACPSFDVSTWLIALGA